MLVGSKRPKLAGLKGKSALKVHFSPSCSTRNPNNRSCVRKIECVLGERLGQDIKRRQDETLGTQKLKGQATAKKNPTQRLRLSLGVAPGGPPGWAAKRAAAGNGFVDKREEHSGEVGRPGRVIWKGQAERRMHGGTLLRRALPTDKPRREQSVLSHLRRCCCYHLYTPDGTASSPGGPSPYHRSLPSACVRHAVGVCGHWVRVQTKADTNLVECTYLAVRTGEGRVQQVQCCPLYPVP